MSLDSDSENCCKLKVFKPVIFSVHWSNVDEFFTTDPKQIKRVQEKIKDAYAIHLYNTASNKFKISKSKPTNIFQMLAEKNCPQIWEAYGDNF